MGTAVPRKVEDSRYQATCVKIATVWKYRYDWRMVNLSEPNTYI